MFVALIKNHIFLLLPFSFFHFYGRHTLRKQIKCPTWIDKGREGKLTKGKTSLRYEQREGDCQTLALFNRCLSLSPHACVFACVWVWKRGGEVKSPEIYINKRYYIVIPVNTYNIHAYTRSIYTYSSRVCVRVRMCVCVLCVPVPSKHLVIH